MKPTYEELAAQVESLINAIKAIENDCIECSYDDESGYFVGNDAISDACELAHYATPQQALIEIRADAVADFVMFLPQYSYNINGLLAIEAKKYANKIQKGGEK